MPGTIYYTERAISTASATTAATGYAAENVGNRRIRKSWRSTATTEQVVTIDMGSDVTIDAVCVQHANWSSATLTWDDAAGGGASYETMGTLTTYPEGNGRRKGHITGDWTARYIRITIPNGTPTDGASYKEIGAVYIMGSTQALPRNPEYALDIDYSHPQVEAQLPNGRVAVASTGADYASISGEFKVESDEDAQVLHRLSRAGVVWLTMGVTLRGELQWPVRHVVGSSPRQLQNPKIDSVRFELREET